MNTIKKKFCRYVFLPVVVIFLVLVSSRNAYAQATDNFGNPPAPDSIRIFDYVQVQPKFLGGDVQKYFNENAVNFPAGTKVKQGNGRVWVNFVVEKDGSVSTIKILRTSDSALNKEAIRITAASKWVAGEQNGMVVRAQVLKLINFKVSVAPSDSTMKK
jgi:periplasmic protein TonB